MEPFQLPGRTPVTRTKARLLKSNAASYRWNQRNLEAPWYSAWIRQLEDLTADLDNIELAAQDPLWHVEDKDTGHAIDGSASGSDDEGQGEDSAETPSESPVNSDDEGEDNRLEGGAVVPEGVAVGLVSLVEDDWRDESPDPIDFLSVDWRDRMTPRQSHGSDDSGDEDFIDNKNIGNIGDANNVAANEALGDEGDAADDDGDDDNDNGRRNDIEDHVGDIISGSSVDDHISKAASSIESDITLPEKEAKTRVPDFALLHFLAKPLSLDHPRYNELDGIRITHKSCVLIAEVKRNPSRRAEGAQLRSQIRSLLSSARIGLAEQCSFAFRHYPKLHSVIGVIGAGVYWSHATVNREHINDQSDNYKPTGSKSRSGTDPKNFLSDLNWSPTTELDTEESNQQMKIIHALLQEREPLHPSILTL
ncbi:hypothetical protein B0H21DRAFT_52514 [Amylocystis lapponica]|nr:hypothetical protein B0H21DRAFT_52514 [Amylocystis lapponica]